MRLRGKDVAERLNKLNKQGGALCEFIKNSNDRAFMNIKLTRENQSQLEKAVENVDSLRQNIKV